MANIRKFVHVADGLENVLLHSGKGEVYSVWHNMLSVTAAPKIYVSDATATGVDGKEIYATETLAAGTAQVTFDPPALYDKGLVVNLSATGDTGNTWVHWSPRSDFRRGTA